VDCPFFAYCGGYFKWPRRDYDCAGVKRLFDTLQTAATEVRQALADFDAGQNNAASS
jgi:hypothetical protein